MVLSRNLPGGTEENHENLIQNSRSPGVHLRPGPPEYRAEVFSARPRSSVVQKSFTWAIHLMKLCNVYQKHFYMVQATVWKQTTKDKQCISEQQASYVRSDILTPMKMSMLVFWLVKPCGLVGRSDQSEDGNSMFLRNFGIYLQVNAAWHPRRSTLKIDSLRS
jgi:hypothetical protein